MRHKMLISLMSVALAAGCGGAPEVPAVQAPSSMPTAAPDLAPKIATAKMEARSGSQVTGLATLTQTGDSVKIVVTIAGAEPGDHGLHVHDNGDCSAADGTSAGGHFNPHAVEHGAPGHSPSHAGDFGNIVIGEDGTGTLELTTTMITLGEGETSVAGRAIIFHAKKDDFGQPTGNAGPRNGCGVITLQ